LPGRWYRPWKGDAATRSEQATGLSRVLNTHVHDVAVGLDHAVSDMQRGLEADLGFLHGEHGFFQAHLGVAQLNLGLKVGSGLLRRADFLERRLEVGGKAGLHPPGGARAFQGGRANAVQGLAGQGGNAHVHGGLLRLI